MKDARAFRKELSCMERDSELQTRVRRSIEKLLKLSLQVSAKLFPNDVIATKINDVIDELNGTAQVPFGLLAEVQEISVEDKIAQLDVEIQELFTMTLLSDPKHHKKSEIVKQAYKHLKEYRALLEGDIKKKYTSHPAYKVELDDEAILKKYKQLGSLRAVGKALGCDPKTVKERLIRMGHIKG